MSLVSLTSLTSLTSPRSIRVRGLMTLVVVSLSLFQLSSIGSAQDEATLESVLSRFRAMPGMEAHFREEKAIALLSVPLVSEGVVHFAPPGRLARHVTAPATSSMILNGGEMTLGDDRGSRTVNLVESPVVAVFVESFVHLLAGDRDALAARFELGFAAEGSTFSITLRPKDERIRGMVESIIVSGDQEGVKTLIVRERNGDVATTTFSRINNRREYSDAERARLFRVPSR